MEVAGCSEMYVTFYRIAPRAVSVKSDLNIFRMGVWSVVLLA